MVALLCLLLLGAPATAAPAAPTSRPATSATSSYVDHLRGKEGLLIGLLLAQRDPTWFLDDAETQKARRERWIARCWEVESSVMAVPAPPGAEAARDTTLAIPRYLRDVHWGSGWDASLALYAARPVTGAHRDELERRVRAEAEHLQALRAARDQALAALSVAEGVKPVGTPGGVVVANGFTHPKFPPAPSALSSAEWIGFPMAYSDHATALVLAVDQVMTDWIPYLNGGTDYGLAALPDIRRRALGLQGEVDAMPPWEGDDTLRAHLREQVNELLELTGPMATQMLALLDRWRLKRGEYEAFGRYRHRINSREDRTDAFHREVAAFRYRWGVDDLLEWVAERDRARSPSGTPG